MYGDGVSAGGGSVTRQIFNRNRNRNRRPVTYRATGSAPPTTASQILGWQKGDPYDTGAVTDWLNGPGPTSPGGGGARYRTSGGGGGPSPSLLKQIAAMRGILDSDFFDPRDFNVDRRRVSDAVAADTMAAQNQYGAIQNRVQGAANPWSDAPVEANKAGTDQLALLKAQGVDPSAYLAETAGLDAEAQNLAAARTQQNQTMRNAWLENQQSRMLEAQQAATGAEGQLTAAQRAMEAQIDQMERAEQDRKRNERMTLIMQLIPLMAQAGQDVNIEDLLGGN